MAQRITSSRMPLYAESKPANRGIWTTERVARLVVGCAVLAFSLLGYFVHQGFYLMNSIVAFNLVLSSLTESCLFHKALVSMGFKDREDVYSRR